MPRMDAPRFLDQQFLIAMPSLTDPYFAHGVALVCQHGEDGAMGLLVNRLSEFSLGDVLAQMGIPCDSELIAATPVLSGGPVQPERGFVLHDGGDAWDSTLVVAPGLHLTTSREILVAMARGEGPRNALVALGYAGWVAGQLEAELQDNAWLTAPCSTEILFQRPIEDRWRAAARSIGVDFARLAGYSGRA